MLPLVIELRPSRWLLFWIVGIHTVTAVITVLIAMPVWLRISLIVIIFGGLLFQLKRLFGAGISAPKIIHIQPENNWRLIDSAGNHYNTTPVHRLIFRYLVVIYLTAENGKRITLLIPEDSVSADKHRKLRAGLKFFKPNQ